MQQRLAYAIRAAMAVKDWKPPDLARAMKRDPSTTARWADGTSVPSLLVLKQLAEVLGVRPEFLYDPPPIPDYPLSEYLVREATATGVEEGIAAAARPRRRRAAAPGSEP